MTKSTMKLLTGIVGVVTAVALVGGGTMAWFTDKKEVAASKFTAGTVEIQAGQSVVEDTDESGKPLYYEDVAPTSVSSVLRGTDKNGKNLPSPNNTKRNNPNKVLTKAQEQDETEIYCMGYGGEIVVRFDDDKPLLKGDVLVIEGTWGGSATDYVETAKVYVSEDNNDWTYAGTVSNQTNPKGDYHKSMVPNPIDTAHYVKLVDTTQKTLSNGKENRSEDGFDIDYICGRNIIDEANWNPGDINKLAFYVTNSGTKDINVRVKLEGHWETLQGSEWKENDDLAHPDMISINNPKGWTKKGDFYYCSSNDKSGLKGVNGGESPSATDTIAVLDLEVTLSGNADNEYQNAKYVLTPTFQAIQHSHSDGWDWDNFDTYNGTSED
ncbi:TasA family protein [Clostridium sp. KNHs216]|uniref:TasA family protein n=1 Tax=Clostridium sp. KNHs216 TaxID=1550235 RepID=UPI00114DD894|nr:TasA family protein [Clostridium sp. KNHs216]TQI68730.1 putative ribosomally synthesized peptide with SipW-like signal peptide [Clostridium sp. KNHs216]